MIIVEGPDGAGKTTLVNRLSEELDLPIGQRGTQNRDELWKVTRGDTYKALAHEVGGEQPAKLWDRLFFSEMVYAPLGMPARDVEFSPAEQVWIKRVLNAIGCPIILCYTDPGIMAGNAAKDHQMAGVKEKHLEICNGYTDLFKDLRDWPSLIWYDYTGRFSHLPGYADYETLKIMVKLYLAEREERQW